MQVIALIFCRLNYPRSQLHRTLEIDCPFVHESPSNMDLLDVTATFVPVPPYFDINEHPVDVFDKLTAEAHLFNSLFRAAKLNASFITATKMGSVFGRKITATALESSSNSMMAVSTSR